MLYTSSSSYITRCLSQHKRSLILAHPYNIKHYSEVADPLKDQDITPNTLHQNPYVMTSVWASNFEYHCKTPSLYKLQLSFQINHSQGLELLRLLSPCIVPGNWWFVVQAFLPANGWDSQTARLIDSWRTTVCAVHGRGSGRGYRAVAWMSIHIRAVHVAHLLASAPHTHHGVEIVHSRAIVTMMTILITVACHVTGAVSRR